MPICTDHETLAKKCVWRELGRCIRGLALKLKISRRTLNAGRYESATTPSGAVKEGTQSSFCSRNSCMQTSSNDPRTRCRCAVTSWPHADTQPSRWDRTGHVSDTRRERREEEKRRQSMAKTATSITVRAVHLGSVHGKMAMQTCLPFCSLQ